MVTEIGFVSLLVAAFGAFAGGLAYLAVRVSRGPEPDAPAGSGVRQR